MAFTFGHDLNVTNVVFELEKVANSLFYVSALFFHFHPFDFCSSVMCVCVFSGRPCRYVQIHIECMIEYLHRLRSSRFPLLLFFSISVFNPRHLVHIFFQPLSHCETYFFAQVLPVDYLTDYFDWYVSHSFDSFRSVARSFFLVFVCACLCHSVRNNYFLLHNPCYEALIVFTIDSKNILNVFVHFSSPWLNRRERPAKRTNEQMNARALPHKIYRKNICGRARDRNVTKWYKTGYNNNTTHRTPQEPKR